MKWCAGEVRNSSMSSFAGFEDRNLAQNFSLIFLIPCAKSIRKQVDFFFFFFCFRGTRLVLNGFIFIFSDNELVMFLPLCWSRATRYNPEGSERGSWSIHALFPILSDQQVKNVAPSVVQMPFTSILLEMEFKLVHWLRGKLFLSQDRWGVDQWPHSCQSSQT